MLETCFTILHGYELGVYSMNAKMPVGIRDTPINKGSVSLPYPCSLREDILAATSTLDISLSLTVLRGKNSFCFSFFFWGGVYKTKLKNAINFVYIFFFTFLRVTLTFWPWVGLEVPNPLPLPPRYGLDNVYN